jgi:mono/diheme cytochrome c family protein
MIRFLRTISLLGYLLGGGAVCLAQDTPWAEQLLNDLACSACHDGLSVETDIRDKAPDLSQAGLRFSPDHVFTFVQYPVKIRQHIGSSRMPNFYLDERESLALSLYLRDLIPPGSARPSFVLQKSYEDTRSANPQITAQVGEDVFKAMNCIACHKQESMVEWEHKNAPDLSAEGVRVKREWLEAYLKKPEPIRPFGFYPGSGSRHPDFMLSESEVETLTDHLLEQRGGDDYPSESFEPEELLRFSMEKAKDLLQAKLPCLGCHRLGREGGRIGPDLSSVGSRLQADFVYHIISDPQAVMPETVMPKVEMPPATLDLLVNYLMQQDEPRETSSYLSPIDYPPQFHQDFEEGERLYVEYCASCHGITGDGDGYNAQYLPKTPVQHSDSSYMSTRSDDVLFDAIYAGGYVMNKSPRMPPWGFTLERSQIWQLVAYLRHLCRCEGPSWSRRDH